MDGLAIMSVSAAIVALMHLLRWAGVPRQWAPLLVPALAALGVGVWAIAHGPFTNADIFNYIAGWIAVTTSAATVWGFRWAAAGRLERDARRMRDETAPVRARADARAGRRSR